MRYRLTPTQAGMMFQRQLTQRADVDMVQMTIDIEHPLDVERFRAAWRAVTARHELLRTRFLMEADGCPVQEVVADAETEVCVVDLRGKSTAEQAVLIEQGHAADKRRGFDLAQAPLQRVTVFDGGEKAHVLWTVHHIVVDGRACLQILQEVFDHYDGMEREQAQPRAFREYVEWIEGLDHSGTEEFWRNHFAGLESVTPLFRDPAARATPDTPTFVKVQFLDADTSAKLRDLCKREELTLNSAMQALLAIALSRYSGEEDVVFGATKTTRRSIPQGDSIIGPMIATVPVRAQLADKTALQLAKDLREAWVSYRDYDHTPFSEIQRATGLAGEKLFDVLLVCENVTFGATLPWANRHARVLSMDPNYALLLMVSGGREVELRLYADSHRFSQQTTDRIAAHLQQLVRQFVAEPTKNIANYELVTSEEKQELLHGYNAARIPLHPRAGLHHYFEAQSAAQKDGIALVHGATRMTYAQLNHRANQIAHALVAAGITRDQLVGIYLERTPEMVAAILGVLKSGGAYVPLDPKYPVERIDAILEDAKPAVVLTTADLAASIGRGFGIKLLLDGDSLAQGATNDPDVSIDPHQLAYVLFTSGSTGRPKGVAIEHFSATTLVEWSQQVFSREELAGMLFSTSISFDLSVFEMMATLAAGGTLHLAENALSLPAMGSREEITFINTVPSAMRELLRTNAVPSSVQVIALAGEALPDALVEEAYAKTSAKKVFNLYGPTEDTTYSTFTLIERGRHVTIGKPITNTQAYILDRHRNLLPAGVPGELYLVGDGLARGYYGRPELTAERFVRDPFYADPPARMYKTGDLCRWLPDGDLEYLGRLDHQVKVRGFRIELGEIENVLSAHPAVAECAAIVREDSDDKRVVGYVVLQADCDTSTLREFVRSKLPDFMVPASFVALDALPLTPNGKVDRKRLPAPQAEASSQLAELTSTEAVLAGIWSEVLGCSLPARRDNFFYLGGHSLLAMQLGTRIQQAFALDIPLRMIFDNPTLEGLARRIDEELGEDVDELAELLLSLESEGTHG